MNGKDLLLAMQKINDTYIMEAAEAAPAKKRMPLWGWLTTAAACLVVLCTIGLVLRPGSGPQGGPEPSLPLAEPSEDTAPSSSTEPSEEASPSNPSTEPLGDTSPSAPSTEPFESEPPAEATIPAGQDPALPFVVDMDDVLVNENCAISVVDHDINLDELFPLTWEAEDVEAYFGWDLQPGYVKDIYPKVERDDSELRVQVYADANGDVKWDTVPISWSEPALPAAELDHWIGFTLTASRLGIFYEDFSVFASKEMTSLLPEADIQVTDIGGTSVVFGHECGSYDYDVYMSKFTVNGVDYRIIAHDLSLRDVVILTTDVICQSTGHTNWSVND